MSQLQSRETYIPTPELFRIRAANGGGVWGIGRNDLKAYLLTIQENGLREESFDFGFEGALEDVVEGNFDSAPGHDLVACSRQRELNFMSAFNQLLPATPTGLGVGSVACRMMVARGASQDWVLMKDRVEGRLSMRVLGGHMDNSWFETFHLQDVMSFAPLDLDGDGIDEIVVSGREVNDAGAVTYLRTYVVTTGGELTVLGEFRGGSTMVNLRTYRTPDNEGFILIGLDNLPGRPRLYRMSKSGSISPWFATPLAINGATDAVLTKSGRNLTGLVTNVSSIERLHYFSRSPGGFSSGTGALLGARVASLETYLGDGGTPFVAAAVGSTDPRLDFYRLSEGPELTHSISLPNDPSWVVQATHSGNSELVIAYADDFSASISSLDESAKNLRPFPIPGRSFAGSVVDLDCDGNDEVLSASDRHRRVDLIQRSGDDWVATSSLSLQNAPSAAVVVSKAGSAARIAVVHTLKRLLSIYDARGSKSEGFTSPLQEITLPGMSTVLAGGDVNGDGRVDLLVGYLSESPSIEVFLQSEDGTFLSSASSAPRCSFGEGTSEWFDPPTSLALDDLNGDSVPDLISFGEAGGICVFKGAGDGTFALEEKFLDTGGGGTGGRVLWTPDGRPQLLNVDNSRGGFTRYLAWCPK